MNCNELTSPFPHFQDGELKPGDYHLYPVKDESGNKLSFFAPVDVHAILAKHRLKSGDEFILTCVENGKK